MSEAHRYCRATSRALRNQPLGPFFHVFTNTVLRCSRALQAGELLELGLVVQLGELLSAQLWRLISAKVLRLLIRCCLAGFVPRGVHRLDQANRHLCVGAPLLLGGRLVNNLGLLSCEVLFATVLGLPLAGWRLGAAWLWKLGRRPGWRQRRRIRQARRGPRWAAGCQPQRRNILRISVQSCRYRRRGPPQLP